MTTEPQKEPTEVYATLVGPIDDMMAQKVIGFYSRAMMNKVQTVHLVIQSGGGAVSPGIALYNFILGLPVTTITYNIGQVSSIAAIIFLAGKTRRAAVNATFIYHRTSITPTGPIAMTCEFMRTHAETIEVDNRNTETILRANINLPEIKWRAYQTGDLFIEAREAKNFGIVHEIVAFKVPLGIPLVDILSCKPA